MPLASNRKPTGKADTTMRRSAANSRSTTPTAAAPKVKKRRQSLSEISARKRPSLGSASNKENQPSNKRRNSMSVVGEAKMDRGFIRPEPPVTRSAAKKKARKPLLPPSNAVEQRRSGVVLNFSPPDQRANEEREMRELASRLQARDSRVEYARDNGQLLVYSPSGRLKSELNFDSDGEPSPVSSPVAHDNSTEHVDFSSDSPKSKLTERSESTTTNDDIMRELKALQSRYKEQSQTADAAAAKEVQSVRLELEAQKVHGETLTMTNKKLEDANQRLSSDVKTLEGTISSTKETYLLEKTRLEGELAASKRDSSSVVKDLQESKANLQQHVAALSKEKEGLQTKVSKLEGELKSSQDELVATKELLESLQSDTKSQHTALNKELRRQTELCKQLQADLDSEKDSAAALEKDLETALKDIDMYEKELLPESESQLHYAKEELERQKQATAACEQKVTESQQTIEQLNSDLASLRETMEEERLQFQNLNESSFKEHERITHELQETRNENASMKEELDKARNEITQGKEKIAESTEETQASKSRVIELQKDLTSERQLSEKLSDDLRHRESESDDLRAQLEEAKKQVELLQQNLEEAHETIKEISTAKQEAVSNSSDTSKELKKLKTDLEAMEAQIRHMEEELHHRQLRISDIEGKLKYSNQERDDAQSRLQTFDVREEELRSRLLESERIRRELHNRVIQLSGNMRVFARVRQVLPDESQGVKSSAAARGRKRKISEELVQPEGPFHYPSVYSKDKTSSNHSGQSILRITQPPKDRGGLQPRPVIHDFFFDDVFGPDDSQEDVFAATEPLVQSVIDGYNVCFFAYGQTGSGKTHTMLGESGNEGIIGRTVQKIFHDKQSMEALSRGETQVSILVEVLEIYNEEVRDLLAPMLDNTDRDVKLRANEAEGNIEMPAYSKEDVMEALKVAQGRRCVKATKMNSVSSRSHLIFTITVNVETADGVSSSGRLHVCDLAGSEQLKKSESYGERLKETQNINSSLSVLSRVIESLQAGSPHIPFRESKLTSLLQNSLGGNSKTLAIVCCNPLSSHYNESLNSLRFGEKASRVELKAQANCTL